MKNKPINQTNGATVKQKNTATSITNIQSLTDSFVINRENIQK
jgi:hypothetical protein